MRGPTSLPSVWSYMKWRTGRKAFAGDSKASLTAAILTSDPPPITKIQPLTPPALERLVKKCMNKDPDERWQTARDLTSELKWIAEAGGAISAMTSGAETAGLKSIARGGDVRDLLGALGRRFSCCSHRQRCFLPAAGPNPGACHHL